MFSLAAHKNLYIFDTPEHLAIAAALQFIEYAQDAAENGGRFSVALAGGKTPKRLYELLASDEFRDGVDWSRVHLFFGDERAVPPDHPESNYRMVVESLISKVSIPEENVSRILGEIEVEESALAYERKLRAYFAGLSWPRFDLVLLGMGNDGHVASLFPNSEVLEEGNRWVVATRNPHGQNRISLTIPAINHAARVLFLVTGSEKAATLARVVKNTAPDRLPAQLIQGSAEWFVDRAAASLL